MFVALHVIIALTSIAYGSLAAIRPTKRGLRVSYGLIAGTLASGTYLTFSLHANLLRVCLTGLVYLSVVGFLLAAAHRRLAKAEARHLN